MAITTSLLAAKRNCVAHETTDDATIAMAIRRPNVSRAFTTALSTPPAPAAASSTPYPPAPRPSGPRA